MPACMVGQTVYYIINMGTHWEARGPVQIRRVILPSHGPVAAAILSDHEFCRVALDDLHATFEAAVLAAHHKTNPAQEKACLTTA